MNLRGHGPRFFQAPNLPAASHFRSASFWFSSSECRFDPCRRSSVIEGLRKAHGFKVTRPMVEQGKETTMTTMTTMNGDIKSYKAEFVINDDAPKVKTLDLRLAVTKRDLGNKVKRAFELAKIAGQEFDLIFSHATS
jgi:hypothetical protein